MLFKVSEKPNKAHVSVTSLRECHERLGHVNEQTLKKAIDSQAVIGVNPSTENTFFCESCQFRKAHFLSSINRTRIKTGSRENIYT